MSLDLFAHRTISTSHLLALFALSIVTLAFLSGAATAGCNSGNVANSDKLDSANCQAGGTGTFATAVGNTAQASGTGGTAFGHDARANATNTTSIGWGTGNAGAPAEGATSIGAGVGIDGAGYYSVAIGAGGGASGNAAIALGVGTVAIGAGYTNQPGAQADGSFSVAVGNKSRATGQGYATAIGYNARADVGLGPTAVGTDVTARGTGAAAIGRFSFAAAEGSTALGPGAWAKRKNSVALGAGSVTEAGNTVSVGTPNARRRIVNVAKAIDPSDAVPLSQVQQLVAAGAANSKLGSLGSTPRQTAARSYRVASLGDVAIPGRSPRLGAPVAAVSCEFASGKVVTAVDDLATESAAFSAIAHSAISFAQGGTENGCVTLSFSAEVSAPAGSIMEVRAVMDGRIEASPGPVLFSQQDDAFRSRAFIFLFPDVSPGAHSVELEFRNAGEDGFVHLGQRTTMVKFAK